MLPVLLNLGFIKIYTFGVFLVLAFFWGAFFLWKLIRLTSFKEEDVFDGVFLSLLGALFFARLIYIILNFSSFGFDILRFILINGYPGMSLVGGLLGGSLILFFYFTSKKVSFLEAIDYFIPAIFLALAFGKLGSFFSGAEVGAKTSFFLAIKYVGFDGLRHLTPFYESLLFFLGAYIGYRLIFEIRKERLLPGFNFSFFIFYFGFTYLLFDKLKYQNLRVGSYSFNLLVALILFLTGSFYFLYYFRHQLLLKFKKINIFKKKYGKKTNKRTAIKSQEKTG